MVCRARLPGAAAATVGTDLVDSCMFVQDVGRFLFAYPVAPDGQGDVVWTVGVTGEGVDKSWYF